MTIRIEHDQGFYDARRLTDVEEWEFYELSDAEGVVGVVGLRVDTGLDEVKYELWEPGEEQLTSTGSAPLSELDLPGSIESTLRYILAEEGMLSCPQ